MLLLDFILYIFFFLAALYSCTHAIITLAEILEGCLDKIDKQIYSEVSKIKAFFYCSVQSIIKQKYSQNLWSSATSWDVPGPALPRGQRSDLGTVRLHVRESHFVQIHREKLLVLPQVTVGEEKHEEKSRK